MKLDRILNWLYPETTPLVLGAHFGEHHISIVALRSAPVRLVAVGRQIDFDDAVINDEIRLTVALAADVAELCQRLRVPPGTPTVVAVEPARSQVQLVDSPVDADRIPVPLVLVDRVAEVVAKAGLDLIAIDPVPVALARIGRGFGESCLVVHPESRWEVFTGPDFLDGRRRPPGSDETSRSLGGGLLAGIDGEHPRPVEILPGVEVPDDLAGVIDIGRDAVALSAALAGLGRPPLPAIETQSAALTDGWDVEPVLPVERSVPVEPAVPVEPSVPVDRFEGSLS